MPHQDTTPRENLNYFYKAGKTHKGAQRWQCKTCKKKTSYIPTQRQSITYNQKRNKVLHDFSKLVISHTPVKRICEFLGIGSQTYYAKLNLLYEKCIMFLERHELPNLKQLEVDEMWLNTDVMTYHLNNLRRKGKGGTHITRQNKDALPVDVVITGDNQSRFIFGSDVVFHSYITPEELFEDTVNYHEDHLRDYAKQFAHLE